MMVPSSYDTAVFILGTIWLIQLKVWPTGPLAKPIQFTTCCKGCISRLSPCLSIIFLEKSVWMFQLEITSSGNIGSGLYTICTSTVSTRGWDLAKRGWDLTKLWMRWVGFDLSILRHRGFWGAADEAALNSVLKEKTYMWPFPNFLSLHSQNNYSSSSLLHILPNSSSPHTNPRKTKKVSLLTFIKEIIRCNLWEL